MNYTIALSIAAKATAYLQDNEGSMSDKEAVLSVYALSHALKAIAKHNFIEDLYATTTKAEKESAGLGIAGINVRFFCQVWDNVGGVDVVEIDEHAFAILGGRITYDRTTIAANGCRQICLTTDATLDE